MSTNLQLATTEPKKIKTKNELSEKLEQEQNYRNGDLMEDDHCGGGGGEWGREGTGNKKHNWQVQNRQWEVKNSIGNVEAKELICMTHGHELRRGECGWEGCAGQRGIKGEIGQL